MAPLALSGDGDTAAPVSESPIIRVWDPLVRVFHWSLVASFTTAYLVEDPPFIHENAGYIALGLLAFRIVWGFFGSTHARFKDFVKSPAVVKAYLRSVLEDRSERHLGHNPAGGAMILMLILSVGLTAGSGWLSVTDRFWGVNWLEDVHEFSAHLSVILIFIHVSGVVLASWTHRENLVRAMITGNKRP